MRYKVKRVYFTLLIPAVIAIIIFSYLLYIGWAPVPNLGPVHSTSTATLTKLQEYYILTNQTSLEKNLKVVAPPNPHNFDFALVVCTLIGLTPYTVDITMKERRQRLREADFTDFLFELSELVRGGIDPIKATNTLAEGSSGSITNEVRMVAKQMQIGYSFEEAMRNLGESLQSPLVDRYVDLVVQASYSGGSVANLIQRASADMSTFLAIEREKRAGLAQYTLILYTAQVILIGLSAVLVVQFLPDLSAITSIGGSSLAGSILGQADIGSVNLERDLFYLCLINGFLGGLVIGKISEEKIKYGIKHALILMVVAFLAWSLFVVPALSATSPNVYKYTILPHDSVGYPTLPLAHPVTVRVDYVNGTPAEGVIVYFAIVGPSTASVLPTSAPTADNGEASTQPVMGSATGEYFITVTVAGNTTGFAIDVKNAGG